MRRTLEAARLFLALGTAAATLSCHAFERAGPEGPDPFVPPTLVDVTVEYRQINECVPGSPRCQDNVVFFGSWMRPGEEFFLKPGPGRFVWTGTARRVPVNFPPRDQPYLVRVYDPFIVAGPTEGASAERLKVGGESINRFFSPGNAQEYGLVFIDANGLGHTPF
jgi:hypothetical protein